MSRSNKEKSTKNGKKTDGKFHAKHIKHDPQAESARAVFGMNREVMENKNEAKYDSLSNNKVPSNEPPSSIQLPGQYM